MTKQWIHESPAYWDAAKAAIVGGATPGTFAAHYESRKIGDLLPGDWWRAEENGKTLGFGWMDITWGDAEVLLAVLPGLRGSGVGTSILDHLEDEAAERGLHYLYNVVPVRHPDPDQLRAWLEKRNFKRGEEDGRLLRAVVRRRR